MTTCDFCGRPDNEVKGLVAGITQQDRQPHICNRCAESANRAFQATAPEKPGRKNQTAFSGTLPKPLEIKAYLDQHVIGQDACKEAISVAVYNHYKRRTAGNQDVDIQKSNILMLGPSGSGKTEVIRAVSKMLGVPFHKHDASKLTQAGYVGDDVETLLQGLIGACDGSIEEAQWGIVFLDEVDKLARKSGRNASGYRDVGGEGVQQALLTIIEGATIRIPRGAARLAVETDLMDTTNILFICAGSFDGIQDIVNERLAVGTGRVGFGGAPRAKSLDLTGAYQAVQEGDILEFGLIPELAGRLPVVTSTLPLTDDEMLRILSEPKNALTKQFQALFSMDGIKLEFESDALQAISNKACGSSKGARALRGILEGLLRKSMLTLPGQTGTLVVTAESVESGSEPVFYPALMVSTG